jgi:hypothetical protein
MGVNEGGEKGRREGYYSKIPTWAFWVGDTRWATRDILHYEGSFPESTLS